MGTQRDRRRPAAPGFTLMEMMIVVALAALILAIGAPNFSEFRRNNRLTAIANDVLASVQLARTEAVKRQHSVSLCASDQPGAAAPACAAGGGLSGWIVFDDVDGDCQRDGDEAVIRGEGPLDASLHGSADGACMSFAATGFRRSPPGGAALTHLLICDERGTALQAGTSQSAARGIEIARTGRAAITRDPATIASWELACP